MDSPMSYSAMRVQLVGWKQNSKKYTTHKGKMTISKVQNVLIAMSVVIYRMSHGEDGT